MEGTRWSSRYRRPDAPTTLATELARQSMEDMFRQLLLTDRVDARAPIASQPIRRLS